MCDVIRDLHMIAVDMWKVLPKRDDPYAETYITFHHEENYARFKAAAEKFFPTRIQIMRMDTSEAAELVPDESLDFVFIDADHTYEGCKRDIENWVPKVRRGGMIAGHDANWPSVRKAIDELGATKIASDNVWYCFRKQNKHDVVAVDFTAGKGGGIPAPQADSGSPGLGIARG